ncbi:MULTISPECIES: hypothetical protein [Ralstonia solanacearum species complex]|uniref:hypothetical protein n=1 Tax=Ralstonia solanacearum species complex TaxID=3116862 RepID=UPI000E5799DB|nr:hypothetical protein [Ralstonia solanacearum]BEU72120.1 hypothetical protein MAFF211271_16750 [Ralstonia pseudosolanacearum]AXV77016.1 hypothetical protein CJO76_08545 [Ralstonia solanacearum]AXV91030.1 hypothetical protein CJO79_08525 [Ralstonia solanacearum]AXW19179.1 hypothetical protein CJO85_08575 [Ralstonia solanacearum]AXW75940.1 hypothetical protein CJO97_08520 [Ralstonia solanacearum]
MSRLSTESLAIGIGAGALALGKRRSALARLHAAFGPWAAPRSGRFTQTPADTPADAVAGATPDNANTPNLTVEIDAALRYTEQGALDALRRALTGDAPVTTGTAGGAARATRRAAIVLDDFWGNHAILRGDFRSMHARDVDEVARAYFADVFGADAPSASIRWQLRDDGRALFASALSRALLNGIGETCGAARVEVGSIRLGLQQMLNHVRGALTDRDGLLLVIDETMLHAVTIESGRWLAYDAQRVFPDASGVAVPIAEVARHVFERSLVRHRHDCDVYLCGLAVDHGQFDPYFDHVHPLTAHMSDQAPARRLMELAQ